MTESLKTYEAVRRVSAALAGTKPEEVALLAVSKTWPAEDVADAARCDGNAFGENYVQEGVISRLCYKRVGARVAFQIGPIAGNKTRLVALSDGGFIRSIARRSPNGCQRNDREHGAAERLPAGQ